VARAAPCHAGVTSRYGPRMRYAVIAPTAGGTTADPEEARDELSACAERLGIAP
jgi:hypothetical protein